MNNESEIILQRQLDEICNEFEVVYNAAGLLEKAIQLHEQALELRKAKLADDHPDTLANMNNLAGIYRSTGQPGRTLPLMEQTWTLADAVDRLIDCSELADDANLLAKWKAEKESLLEPPANPAAIDLK